MNGADGLMVLPPMRYNADKNETLEYFRNIVANTSLPIMIYNNPHDYKIEVTLDMFEQLERIPSIQAIKESTRDVSNVTRLKAITTKVYGHIFKTYYFKISKNPKDFFIYSCLKIV